MGHVYSAARRLELIKPWEDMEWLLQEHGSVVLDFGRKRSVGSFASAYAYAGGMPISQAACGRITTRGAPRMRDVKTLQSGSQLFLAQGEQLRSDSAPGSERAELEDTVLQKLTDRAEVAKLVGRQSRQTYHSPNYTGIQPLRTNKRLRLQHEMRRKSQSHNQDTATDDYNPVFVWALMVCADRFEENGPTVNGLFENAVNTMASYIDGSGDRVVKSAAELSKGFDPERLRDLQTVLSAKKAAE